MRILHTADWHLGKRLQEFNRIEEQRQVLDEIVGISDKENVDLVLIAGDLFDTFNPPTEAVELLYKTLHRLSNHGKRAVVAIAGNHDSSERIEAPHPLAASCGIILSGRPQTEITPFELETGLQVSRSEPGFIEIIVPSVQHPIRLLLTPYANEVSIKRFFGKDRPEEELRKILAEQWKFLANKYCDNRGVNLLMAHLYFMSKDAPAPEESDDEKSILHQGGAQAIYSENLPSQIQYAALGHLHRPQEIAGLFPIVYSGSPLSYSFSEAEQQKQVEIIEIIPGGLAQRKSIPLRNGKTLTRQRFEDIDGAVCWLEDHPNVFVELTIYSESYLDAKIKKRLYDAHDGIVSIIPEVEARDLEGASKASLDLNKDLRSLFVDYFHYKKGQLPNEDLLKILDEIINKPS